MIYQILGSAAKSIIRSTAVLAGAETVTDIALFGLKKLNLLRRFRPFEHGTPSHDHLGDILAMLNSDKLQH